MPKIVIGKSLEQITKELGAFKKSAITIAGIESMNHFKGSFVQGGFTDSGLEAWQPRKNDTDPGRALMVGKRGGHLKRSIRILASDEHSITVGVDNNEIPYADIHNEGGTIVINITPAMRGHFWKMYYGTNDARWKMMAITKKQQLTIVIPQRKFIGTSKLLDDKITKKLNAEIAKILL